MYLEYKKLLFYLASLKRVEIRIFEKILKYHSLAKSYNYSNLSNSTREYISILSLQYYLCVKNHGSEIFPFKNSNLKTMTQRPEFPLFPHSIWRPSPPFFSGWSVKSPWTRRDEWRYHSFFNARNRLVRLFPGLGLGLAALGVYITFDKVFNKEKH
jgi:hypothetical protein